MIFLQLLRKSKILSLLFFTVLSLCFYTPVAQAGSLNSFHLCFKSLTKKVTQNLLTPKDKKRAFGSFDHPDKLSSKQARELLFKAHLTGNLRFPQQSSGISLTVFGKALGELFNATEFTNGSTPAEIKKALLVARQAHRKHNIELDLPNSEIQRILESSSEIMPLLIHDVLQLLTLISPKLVFLKNPVNDSLYNGTGGHFNEWNTVVYTDWINRYKMLQTQEGIDYLNSVQRQIHKALWSTEAKELSAKWQILKKINPKGLDLARALENNLFQIVLSELRTEFPEINRPVSLKEKRSRLGLDSYRTLEQDTVGEALFWLLRL